MEPTTDPLECPEVLLELLRNALAEAAAGHGDAISVELSSDSFRVRDQGRGLPTQPHPFSGRPLVEVILMGPRREAKNTLARINASCMWLEVETTHAGSRHRQRYEFALPLAPLEALELSSPPPGTSLSCAPGKGEVPSLEEALNMARQARGALSVSIEVHDLRTGETRSL